MNTTKTCKNCQHSFTITNSDLALYEKLKVPQPTFCHDCRQQRRLAWRNERWMYKRKCDYSGKDIISMYPPDCPFKIYDSEIWWSDKFDGLAYGRDFNFNKPFFEQFRELQLAVPRAALVNKQSENSAFTNHAGKNKNCYLSGCIFGSQDCYYSDWIMNSHDCIDCSYMVENDEMCYETYYAWNSYKAFFCEFIRGCSNVWFCYDCFSSKDCFMCFNLRNKQYCIRNKQYSKEEYENEIAKIFPLKSSHLKDLQAEYTHIKNTSAIRQATYTVNSENSIGDLLFESKNVYFGFDSIHVEDCNYIYDGIDVKDSMDLYHVGWAELMYECHAISNGYNCRFCHFTYDNTNATYCDSTQNCKNVFGCVGLKHEEYCIFNKKYPKEQYEKLVAQITEHMGKTGEFGEFFPINFSPFAYNQARVQEYYPLTRETAPTWSDFIPTPPPINENTSICEITGKPFKMVPGELEFYRKNGIPLPRRHPDQRYLDRIAKRVPRALWLGICSKCGTKTWTSTERMYCKECYLKEIYGLSIS
ncbi:MAG: hypothetical protein WCT46_04550 [Candidatus Gracilibacteria bacterium]